MDSFMSFSHVLCGNGGDILLNMTSVSFVYSNFKMYTQRISYSQIIKKILREYPLNFGVCYVLLFQPEKLKGRHFMILTRKKLVNTVFKNKNKLITLVFMFFEKKKHFIT